MYRLIDTIVSSAMCTLKQNIYTYTHTYICRYIYKWFIINDMTSSTGSRLVLMIFPFLYNWFFPVFCCSPAEAGRSRQILSAMGAVQAEGDGPQLTCSHSEDFVLVAAGLSVLQPCTHDSYFSSSCGTS